MKNRSTTPIKNTPYKEKILLALLPYWTPQIPPMGISSLKGFLSRQGFDIKTVDVNVEDMARKMYNQYFDALRDFVSEKKRGNFYNIGHEVLQNHMMAHINQKDEKAYYHLVKILIAKTFFVQADEQLLHKLNHFLETFFTWLHGFFLNLLETEKPSILGLSVYKGSLPSSLFVLKLTRNHFPHIQTVMGGAIFAQTLVKGTPGFNYFLEKTSAYLDKIIIGEGELLFLKLLRGELPQAKRVFTLEDLDGEVLDLAEAALPDFSDLKPSFYPNLAAYGSRSCPFQCNFCTETIYWGTYRQKSPTLIVDQLTELYQRHNTQLFMLCDSLLNPVVTRLAEEFIRRNLSLYWDGYLRVDHHSCLDDYTLLWRRGGFYRARLGIESGSQKILDAMGKKISIAAIKASITSLAMAGIKTTTYWIVGYPGETEKDFLLTLQLIEELRDSIYEAECNPFGFYPSGQVNSAGWERENKIIPLYPDDAQDMLLVQSWHIDCQPSREETFSRINRFVEHCATLNIPNPYSLMDIEIADQRWKNLHKNAVPPLLDFKNNDLYIDESKLIHNSLTAANPLNTEDKVVFGF